jgi:hypothetical protein
VVIVPVGAVTIEGEPRYYESVADSGTKVRRGFCPACGSPLFASNANVDNAVLGIKVASLDDPSWFKPMADIWTSSAQPWELLDPSIPKIERQTY